MQWFWARKPWRSTHGALFGVIAAAALIAGVGASPAAAAGYWTGGASASYVDTQPYDTQNKSASWTALPTGGHTDQSGGWYQDAKFTDAKWEDSATYTPGGDTTCTINERAEGQSGSGPNGFYLGDNDFSFPDNGSSISMSLGITFATTIERIDSDPGDNAPCDGPTAGQEHALGIETGFGYMQDPNTFSGSYEQTGYTVSWHFTRDPDDDADGIPDSGDNCVHVYNPDQANHDGDQVGDACDDDNDNDGIPDAADNCPDVQNADQANHDDDTLGDACDPDDDNDDLLDTQEALLGTNPLNRDTDGGGVPDNEEVARGSDPRNPADDTSQCSNKVDDDANGLVDYPADPGCESPTDDDESDPYETNLGQTFRPIMHFDKHEVFRPLNAATWAEREHPYYCHGDTTCDSTAPRLAGLADLHGQSAGTEGGDPAHRLSPEFLAFRNPTLGYDTLDSEFYVVSGWRTPYNTVCAVPGNLQDCDTGTSSAIYYHADVKGFRYRYVDYWFFYRFNSAPGHSLFNDEHQGDWEGMTVAVTDTWPKLPKGFVYATYASHYTGWNYLRGVLTCSGHKCGPSDKRPDLYVANGTHASYPDTCSRSVRRCGQTFDVPLLGLSLPEGNYGGEAGWGNNSSDQVPQGSRQLD
jgi:hypothetical protein